MEEKTLLLFGATGSIGSTIGEYFENKGWQVIRCARNPPEKQAAGWIRIDPFSTDFDPSILRSYAPYSAICWAQGKNVNDDVHTVDIDINTDLYRVNCQYILITLKELLEGNLLAINSRLCVISSIWQNIARQEKLSYCMTKAALQGLVMSASADLAADGYFINAILPGALDTPMTRKNLTDEQIKALELSTRYGSLATLQDIASLAFFLCSNENKGITGQFIAVDLGFSHVRLL